MSSRFFLFLTMSVVAASVAGFFIMHTADGPASLAPYLSPNPGQAFLLPVAETNYLPIRDFNVADPIVNAKAASLFDIRSGRWLYARNIDQKLPIASITKLMTAVVLLENLKLTEVFTVSAENINVDGTGADLQRGEELYGQDLFKIMLIKSSNDAALVLAAEARKRGVDVIQRMNEKARELGMLNTSFNDPSGLDDQGSFSTAADLVKLVSYASEFEEITDALKTPVIDVFSFDGRFSHHLINTNRLLGQVEGVVFGKTGYTDNALGTMALMVGVSGGEDRLISIVLGAHDRFGETSGLINWAKKAYRWR